MADKESILETHLRRIRECYPELALDDARLNTDSLNNDVVLAGDRVFRFPRNDRAKQHLDHEIRVLRLVREFVSVNVPEFDVSFADFVSCQRYQGVVLLHDDIVAMSENIQKRIARRLATFFQELHSIPKDALHNGGIRDSGARYDHKHWLKLYEDVKAECFPHMWEYQHEFTRKHFESFLSDPSRCDYSPCLIHGDLGPYHVLFSSDTGDRGRG